MEAIHANGTNTNDLDAIWEACLASLVPSGGDLTSTAQAWAKATDYLQPRRLEETNTLSNPPEDVVEAVSLLLELCMIQDLIDWHSGRFWPQVLSPVSSLHRIQIRQGKPCTRSYHLKSKKTRTISLCC